MVLKWISIVTLFFKYNYLDIAKSKYDIQIDFDISFYVPNHNHSISSKIPIYKSNSSVNQKLVSRNGFGQRYKVHKAKSRSLTGMAHLSSVPCKDDSHHCTTVSARSCMEPLQADVCKRTCGLCINNPLPLPSQPIPPFPLLSTIPKLQNVGRECWLQCNQVDGRCLFCGTEGLCCRMGMLWKGNECDGKIGISSDHHHCVARPEDSLLPAYWDEGSCGPYGNDHNWEWCDTNMGGPCKKQVNTLQCRSGIAKLTEVKGDELASSIQLNPNVYQDPKTGCKYAYFATYTCTTDSCKDLEAWCSFAKPDCNQGRARAACPKSCNICIG